MGKIVFEELVDKLFKIGAIKFGAFKLKFHEKNPKAPLSPFYINLRMPPAGPLTQEIVDEIGKYLWALISVSVRHHYSYVSGVPQAGEPFAKALLELFKWSDGWRIKLRKATTKNGYRFIEMAEERYIVDGSDQSVVLLVDDLITGAESKVETIMALRSAGFIVRDVVVVIDREQGGKE